ncbi:N-acetylmuramoyl-L-alanine amidase [Prevotella sp. oral taxon 376]|uniref:N-acetylmuramoyl-L-alanine amidase family protein n=1 Tax=Prevotella sp. oral taxon 376 TaxID=712466 RepID=UPI000D1DBE48|nr:N-acetylmuramoyl-L-alanine amidase [Prevotella sp. oral taxon 376]PTL33077.1 N-acetylmuramoyl-L-alanine amidase [Prevotella sp. oral taxon 376]
MSRKKFFSLVALMAFAMVATAASHKFTLVLDAGHGGHDTGAVGSISKEKDLTLKYALAFGRLIESKCPDVKVYYTRTADVFVTLSGRAAFANMKKADLFVSVHVNAVAGGRQARGYQTYTLGRSLRNGNSKGIDENLEVARRENSVIFLEKDYKKTYDGLDLNSAEGDIMFEFIQDQNRVSSTDLAKNLQQHICAATGRANGGAHQDNLAVLRLTSMPGCLMELGFISTPDEERFLNSDAALAAYSNGFYNAFMKYRSKHDKTVTVPFKAIETTPVIPQVVPDTYKKAETAGSGPSAKPREQAVSKAEARPEAVGDSSAEGQKPVGHPLSTGGNSSSGTQADASKPVFKIQVMATSKRLREEDARFKSLKGCECYEEDNMFKYTYGASNDYDEIARLRKQIVSEFPQAFIIAFKGGRKVNIQEAIREFKSNK